MLRAARPSRWELETTAASDYAEKLVRLLVCERLKDKVPGVAYDPLAVIGLKLTERKTRMAPMEFRYVRTRIGQSLEEQWTTTALAAPAAKAAA